MSPSLSFLAAAALAGLDLAGLRWFALSIGKKTSGLVKGLMALFLMAKFGLLALAVWLMKDRAWFAANWFAAGLGLPFALYFVWEVRKHVSKR